MKRATEFLSLVKFSHSIFALPFALQAAWLAAGGLPSLHDLLLIVLAAVAARTAAMAFNRLVDRRLDAANPRTANRELPAGKLEVGPVRALVLGSCALFIAAAFALNPLAGWLSFPVLVVLLGYSFVKRFSFLAHLVLGLALALAPLGAWIAVRGRIDRSIWPAVLLALAVWTWVTGFDLIYACQDADHDREAGLHSIPARFGVARALHLSRGLHLVTLAALGAFTMSAGLGWIYWLSVAGAAVLLAWEHSLVAPDDLSRVDMAFFTLNGWIGVALLLGLVLDRLILGV
jgi:4-hydroxybenzoate polyprenyltransferase